MQEEENPSTIEKNASSNSEQHKGEIQGHPSVKQYLSDYATFAGHRITRRYPGERIKSGARVVQQSNEHNLSTPNNDLKILSTVSSVTKDGEEVYIQWDFNEEPNIFNPKEGNLLLFDNAHTGVKHSKFTCISCNKHPLTGIRWKCLICDDIDLCTFCYMDDVHDVSHIFNRIDSENSKGEKVPSRHWTTCTYVCGILENSDVSLRLDSDKSRKGNVLEIKDDVSGRKKMSNLFYKLKDGEKQEINEDSLFKENVKNGTLVYKECIEKKKQLCGKISSYDKISERKWNICVEWDDGTKEEYDNAPENIEVQWTDNYERTSFHNILELQCETKAMYPCYLDHLPILENDKLGYLDVSYTANDEQKTISVEIWYKIETEQRPSYKPVLYLIFANDIALMNEVLEFSKKTKLPCHVVGKKVLFHPNSTDAVFIHYSTSNDTIMELINKGFRVFQRGETDENENEVNYFKRMAEYMLGEKLLPVIVSLSNKNTPKSDEFPILQFKKNSVKVEISKTEYSSNLKTPWNAKKDDSRTNKHDEGTLDDIWTIHDVQSNFDFEALICHVVIGVAMLDIRELKRYSECTAAPEEGNENRDKIDRKDTANALSMYLLKNGKWRIPKECINESFDYRSVEYIYEENWDENSTNALLTDLQQFINSCHMSPIERVKEKKLMNVIKGSPSELYGFIFFALLKKEFYAGARQLVETGFVGIHHILVGCELLKKAADDWKTTPTQKENAIRLKEAFTYHAIKITSFIYETDKKTEDRNLTPLIENDKDEKYIKELGGHAGRLLLNHRYLENAIRFENKTFINNDTVSNILNKMWYGEKKLSCCQVMCFILLASVHLLVMPFLMISMETGPLKVFYKIYKIPLMKVITQMLGYLAVLLAYAYMLLFNLNEKLSYTDMFIVGWMVSLFINETKQAIVSALRKRFTIYLNDSWNHLDWTLVLVYTIAMVLKFGDNQMYQDASKIFLVVAFVLLSIRILHMFSMSKFLGPKLVIIHKMFKDTFIFMVILTVIMMSYNVSFHSLLYPNSELTWTEIEKIMQNGYWMIFGELNLDSDTLSEPECTFNKTIYTSGTLKRCPTKLGLHVSPYLKSIYGLIAVILLLNLLIAIYSDTFAKVQQESQFHWSQLRAGFLEELSVRTIFPIHLQLLEIPACFLHFIIWSARLLKKTIKVEPRSDKQKGKPVESLNDKPMFVRVFLYNTNFDLRLESTRKAEGNGVSKSKGAIEKMEEDIVKILQQQIAEQSRNLERQHGEILQKQLENQSIEHGQILKKQVEDHSRKLEKQYDKMIKELKKVTKSMKKLESKLQKESNSGRENDGGSINLQLENCDKFDA